MPVSFRIYARANIADSLTAKENAASLSELVMKIVGGHPTVKANPPALDNGSILQIQYQTDYGIRVGDDEYEWVIEYLFQLDVPVKS